MKRTKVVSIIAIVLVIAMMTACGGAVRTGLGSVSKISSSREPSADSDGRVQVDVTMAAVSIDGSGKIVKVSIDTAQIRVPIDNSGSILIPLDSDFLTKVERGDDYGMLRVSNIGREWYEQIEELEKWMIGKTIDEVMAMNTKVVDEAHQHVPDEPDLTSRVTITVEGYLAAVQKAVENAK